MEMAVEDVSLVEPLVLFKDRSEWKNVKPIYNNDDEEAVIRIAATDEFTDAFAYLRAVLNVNEMSERAFNLTQYCADLNAANYSVWQYRRNLLKALNKNVEEELELCERIILDNPKNYQVWHHRKVLVGLRNTADGELAFTASMLADDAKNYHVWQYRQWLMGHFNLFTQLELDFATQLIFEDLRNNSAWNYRYFIVSMLSNAFAKTELLDTEIRFTLHCIQKIPNNESPWSYLSGLLIRDGLTSRTEVCEFCEQLFEKSSDSIYLRSFVVDSIVEELERTDAKATERVKRAYQLLSELEGLDPVRLKYWRHRRNHIDNLVQSAL